MAKVYQEIKDLAPGSSVENVAIKFGKHA